MGTALEDGRNPPHPWATSGELRGRPVPNTSFSGDKVSRTDASSGPSRQRRKRGGSFVRLLLCQALNIPLPYDPGVGRNPSYKR